MPKKDLWVGTSDPDPATVVGSAGSCESMISSSSSSSEMNNTGDDYLSVEEKECLMFLEETLDSLDTGTESGVSADETEAAEPSNHPRTWPTRDVPKELDRENLGKQKKIELKDKKCGSSSLPSAGHHSLPRNMCVRETPLIFKVYPPKVTVSSTENSKGLPQIHPTSGESPEHETQWVQSDQAKMNTGLKASDLESVLIPPPEPFQDRGQGHPRRGQETPVLNKVSGKDAESKMKPHFEVRSADMLEMERYEAVAVQQKILPDKKEAVIKPTSPQRNKKNSEQMIDAQYNDKNPALDESLQDPNFKQGPPTAPKPRKLPPNIILKTSKTNVVSLNMDTNHNIKRFSQLSGRPRASTGDFSMERSYSLQKEQEKARREALEKLGLPLDREKRPENQVTSYSPKLTSRTTSREYVNIDIPNKRPEQQSNEFGEKGIYLVEKNIQGVKQANFKSNTLERSGVGLSNSVSTGNEGQNMKNTNSTGKPSFLDKITPNFFRGNRPRTASLGTDLKENKFHDVELEKNEKRRSFPLQQPSKLPRPPCVSVTITPQDATEEHRKEALKKLGLLKE
ncbi:hypothetical protein JRQ81_013915 [Phrynocephalus forsythii]|uniref:Specifically androgen-regulated gene protein n=1 Tax=Phrynocephalus forsythii TaxID=171643 RepID=A0A9Q0XXL9_9SAUR|nr:hypothetical protein JRQ81_013915 [Phrynocephalus forsythii]